MVLQRAEVLDSAYARDCAVMVERHLKARGIDDPLLLEAMGTVPREAFVPEHLQEFVYEDLALPIEFGPDHLAALYRRPHDRACRDQARRHGARGRRRIGLRRGGHEPHGQQGVRHRATRGAGEARRRQAEAARLRQCRNHLRRRHQGLARGGAVPGHHRLRRRSACPRRAEAAARDRRPPDRARRRVRVPDADPRAPHRRGSLRGGRFRRRSLRAPDRGGRLGRARA